MAKEQLLRRPKTAAKYKVKNLTGTHGRKVTFEGYANIRRRNMWMLSRQSGGEG